MPMQEGTHKLLKTYYLLIQQILNRYSSNHKKDKHRLHEAFKAFYRRETGANYSSLTEYNSRELTNLIERILIEFSVEYGIYLISPNDPDNAQSISLAQLLEYKRWTMNNHLFQFDKEVNTLPEGFSLVRSINDLKQLKPRKRNWNEDNIELKYGETVYVYSYRHNTYYEKIITEYTPEEKIIEYINKKILYVNK